MNVRLISLFSFLLFGFSSAMVAAETRTLSSPDQQIVISVSDDKDSPSYQVSFQGRPVLNTSRLGLLIKDLPEFSEGFRIASSKTRSVDQQWEQPWGERRVVRDHYNELLISFKMAAKGPNYQFNVRFKAFNDGLGFRYEFPQQAGLKALEINDELTEFSVDQADTTTTWWIPSRGWNRYEYVYNTTPMGEMDRAHTPLTFRQPSGTHVSIHEAALVDYAAMTLDQQRTGILKANLTPWSDGAKVKTQAGFVSPWRTVQIAADAVGLLNSDLILNLNEPNKLGDVSWVEPGKYVGIWWGMHLGVNTWGSGEKHGATNSETQRYIDFASKYGFDGVLVEGWNTGWDGSWYHNGDVFSFTESYEDFDLPALAEYGHEKGVRIIGHHETSGSVTNYRQQMGDAYDLYEANNVAQVKTGYVADGGRIKRIDEQGQTRHEWHDGQFMVGEYLHSVREAAKRKISINTHEPVKDTGLRRTYPNWIAREGARGQEFNAWGTPPNPPEHTAILPYTRMLSGPMDFTPGIFNLAFEGLDAVNRVKTTLAKQLALYVVLYSPIQMAADLPKHYEANLAPFQFIRDVPTDWEESKALAGEVGDYVVFARQERGGKDWFVGGLTDEEARELDLPLDFLAKGQRYQAEIYRDGKKADWLKNPYAIEIESREVKRGDSLPLRMASSGGFAIRFKAIK